MEAAGCWGAAAAFFSAGTSDQSSRSSLTAPRVLITVASAFVLCTLLLFGFVYWQMTAYMTSTIDVLLTGELSLITADTPDRRLAEIDASGSPESLSRVLGLGGSSSLIRRRISAYAASFIRL